MQTKKHLQLASHSEDYHPRNSFGIEDLRSRDHLDTDTNKVREILGSMLENISDQELSIIQTEIRYLAETWLNQFEMKQFNGKTLQALLNKEET